MAATLSQARKRVLRRCDARLICWSQGSVLSTGSGKRRPTPWRYAPSAGAASDRPTVRTDGMQHTDLRQPHAHAPDSVSCAGWRQTVVSCASCASLSRGRGCRRWARSRCAPSRLAPGAATAAPARPRGACAPGCGWQRRVRAATQAPTPAAVRRPAWKPLSTRQKRRSILPAVAAVGGEPALAYRPPPVPLRCQQHRAPGERCSARRTGSVLGTHASACRMRRLMA